MQTQCNNFVDILRLYEGDARDTEFLAFVGCTLMTGDQTEDKERLAEFLKTVKSQTPSVWKYIDEERYLVDYALDTRMLQLLMLLHEVILTTQTIERSVKYSLQYNGNATAFFEKVFGDYVTPTKVGLFQMLMLHLEIWEEEWVKTMPIKATPQLLITATELGVCGQKQEICLSNMEYPNTVFGSEDIHQARQTLVKLNKIAIQQMLVLEQHPTRKRLK